MLRKLELLLALWLLLKAPNFSFWPENELLTEQLHQKDLFWWTLLVSSEPNLHETLWKQKAYWKFVFHWKLRILARLKQLLSGSHKYGHDIKKPLWMWKALYNISEETKIFKALFCLIVYKVLKLLIAQRN